MIQGSSIKKISNYEAGKIIRSQKPIGKFYCVTTGPGIGQKTTGKTFVGIDNSTADAWTEEFETEDHVMQWLSREDLTAEEIRAGLNKKIAQQCEAQEIIITIRIPGRTR